MSKELVFNVQAAADPHSQYEVPELCAAFTQEEILRIDEYQRTAINGLSVFLKQPLPVDLDEEKLPALQRLIDNTSIYQDDRIKEALKVDPVLQKLRAGNVKRTNESASAMRARRSVIACIVHLATETPEPEDNPEEISV